MTEVRQTAKPAAMKRRNAAPRRMEFRMTAGSKGGKAAAAGMTAAERKARAKKAVAARWAKRKIEKAGR